MQDYAFKRVKFPFAIFLIPLLIFNSLGCSCLRSGHQNFNVMVTPSDAKIYINDVYKGTGTVTATVPSNQPVTIRVTKEGYIPISRMIEKKLSVTGVLDTIGGWLILIPFIGLAFPGAYELEKSSVTLTFSDLDKLNKEGGDK